MYSITCLQRLQKTKIGFQDQLSLNAGQKHCTMLQGEHSAILSTFIKLPYVIKIFVLSIFEWPLKTGFTVCTKLSSGTRGLTETPLTSIMCVCKQQIVYNALSHVQILTWGKGVQTPPPHPQSLENHIAIGFLSNTGPDPLENDEATMPRFNVGP